MARTQVYLGTLLLGLLVGCGSSCQTPGEPETQCDSSLAAPADEVVIPGQLAADGSFEPLQNGDVMPLQTGLQGGHHVELAVRLYAKSGAIWEHDVDLFPPTTSSEMLGGTSERVEACVPGWTVTTGVRVFYYGETSTSSGTPARLFLRSSISDQPEHKLTAGPIDVIIGPR